MRVALHQDARAQAAEGVGVERAHRRQHVGVRAAIALGRRGTAADAGLDLRDHLRLAAEAPLQLHHRQGQLRQLLAARIAATEVVAQQAEPGAERLDSAVHRRGGLGIDPEHRVHRRRQHGLLGLAGIGDPADLRQCLHQPGQGQDARGDRVVGRGFCRAHSVLVSRRRSSGASVVAITAPPRHSSPS